MTMKKGLLTLLLALGLISEGTLAQSSENEKMALDWIKSQQNELQLNPNHGFKLRFASKGLAGEVLRFQQTVGDVPVFQSEVVVNIVDNAVAFSSNSYDKNVEVINVIPAITLDQAIAESNKSLNLTGTITSQEAKLYVYNKLAGTKLVYRVVSNYNDHPGSWEVIVDAKNNQILSTKDISYYYSSADHKKEVFQKKEKNQKGSIEKSKALIPYAYTTGTGMVYLSDPLSAAHVAYGGQYVDGNDATNASLDAARTSVTLPEIDLTAGVYKLKSSYVEIKDIEAPNKGLFTQATNTFNFNRNQDGFEAVNVFYNLDKNMRYINETLGVTCRPFLNSGIVWFDPSGLSGADNSHYTGSNNALAFGEGCVDDGEDGDVIWHELAHGLHDWLTGGALSQVNGLSEGCGDYWAQSNSRSLNQWTAADPEFNYMFSWDGHNPCWAGRTTDYTGIYPTNLVNQVHTDGQIWATVNMKIWDVLGRQKTDKAFLEGLRLTNSTTNQQDAAIAVRQAAINMNYACADIQTMTQNYAAAGYTMPAVALKINCPGTQTVNAGPGNTYTVPSFTSLSNAISPNCTATVTQSPAVGASLSPGSYTVTMTATNVTSVNCPFTLVVQAALGIEDIVKTNLSVYPNPASTQITIKGDFIADRNIVISNVLGQKVMESTLKTNENVIDISSLSLGVYTIKFNDSKTTVKFVKN
jgi:zinc metalloprotease ZmpB